MDILLCILCMGWLPLCLLVVGILAIMAPSSFKKYYFLYAIAIGMLAYCYEPTYEIDLSRYFYQLDYCRTLSFSEAFTWEDDGLIVKNFLFWIISRLGDDHILPLLSMTTVFGVSTYICVDSTNDSKVHPGRLLLFQLMLLPIYNTLSNVRNVVAFSLIILAVYRDLIYRKRNATTILLYVLPCFIHIAGIAIVLIRIALLIIDKRPYLGLILTLGIPSASIALFERAGNINLPGNIGKVLSRAIWKAYSSSVNTSDYAVKMQGSGYFIACRIVMFFVCLILLLIIVKQLRIDNEINRSYKLFCGVITAITLIWIVLGTVKYWVFAFAVIIASSPVLVTSYNDYQNNRSASAQACKYALIILMFARLLLEMYFISKRIVLADYLYSALTCSMWGIIGKAFIYVLLG